MVAARPAHAGEAKKYPWKSWWLRWLLFATMLVVILRLLVAAPSVATSQPMQWMQTGKVGSRSDAADAAEESAPIECPRWDGSGGEIKQPHGPWKRASPAASNVYLYAVVASTAEAQAMLPHFLDLYLTKGGIPASNVAITLHEAKEHNQHTEGMIAVLDAAGVYYDVWVGTFTSDTKAWHRNKLVAETLGDDDWIIVADIDELHQFPGLDQGAAARNGSAPAFKDPTPIESYLRRAESKGFNYVLGEFEDRVGLGGELRHVLPLDPKDAATSIESQFPLRCSMTQWTKPQSGWQKLVLPAAETTKVVAHKAYLSIHRSAHYVKRGSYFRAALALLRFDFSKYSARWPRRDAKQMLRVEHYKWVAGLVPYLDRRVRTYEQCGMLWSYESAAIIERLEQYRGRICTTCGELACARAAPARRRRVAVVTSVWDEHVDGVSITMNRVARFLHRSSHSEVLVVTPHDPAVPHPVVNMAEIPKLAGDSLPIFALIGRNDYVVGMPLAATQKRALIDYDADIYHLVSPDLLGFSAQRWARQQGRCAVCSYHTQIDRYVRYYTAKHSLLDRLKPRVAVQRLFGSFYSGCDIVAVPNDAIGDKLVAKMGVPREKIGYFPRGVNVTQYNPKRRDAAWRLETLNARPDDVVILWAARLVKEKGAALFADAIAALFRNASLGGAAGADEAAHGAWLEARTRIMIVGDGPEREAMRSTLPPRITHFMGHVSGEDLWRAYACSDVYFFPSHTEAFPNTLLEAQASGLTVLAPAYSVNRDLVPRDAGLLLAEHAGAEDFAEGLWRLITQPDLRRKIAARAVQVARKRTWDAAFGDLTDSYDRCQKLNLQPESPQRLRALPQAANQTVKARRR
ncbi:hypothetical protein M885DRAFT_514558 [Pelagophyceae sp. CCMP2097]|nr:hypothetical protein M885DRAFT_514558 [Pelagophyceae sp. CCMP2097]